MPGCRDSGCRRPRSRRTTDNVAQAGRVQGTILPDAQHDSVRRSGAGAARLGGPAEGLGNAAIAARLVLTEGAIEKHTQRIFAKLDLDPGSDQHRRVVAVLANLDRR